MSTTASVKCPNCRYEFPIAGALSEEIEAEIKAKYREHLQKEKVKIDAERAQLLKEAEALKLQAENQDRVLADRMRLARLQLQEEAQKKAAEEQRVQMEHLSKELEEKKVKLRESMERELALTRRESELREKEEALKLELERKMLEKQQEIEEKARRMESERSELRIKELEKKLADQVELAETMRRKAEQGSMQLQGEVMELALEELLRAAFPFDAIDEVAKGTRGADCIQTVRSASGQVCGKIIYESKRTKAFTAEWIDKLKNDMRAQQADIAVIVTEVLPKDMSAFGFRDGVWICRFTDVKPLAFLLRDTLVRISTALVIQENRGEKMQMLYDYLTGTEFRQNIEAVVEGFLSLRDGITRERVQMEKLWKEREKQLDKVLQNTTQFYGSIKGIAGNAVSDLRLLD